jgi:hypothetical protein
VHQFYLDMDGKDERYRRQIYSFTRTLHEGVYYGVCQIFEWARSLDIIEEDGTDVADVLDRVINGERGKGGAHPITDAEADNFRERFNRTADTVRSFLVTSRDGMHWDMASIYADKPMLPPGTCGVDVVAAQMVTVGKYHYFYYECRKGTHRDRFDPPAEVQLARYPVGRMMGWVQDSKALEAALVTRTFTYKSGSMMFVNAARLEEHAHLHVEAVIVEAVLADGNAHTRKHDRGVAKFGSSKAGSLVEINWPCGDTCTFFGKRVQLHFFWKAVELYGFELRALSA